MPDTEPAPDTVLQPADADPAPMLTSSGRPFFKSAVIFTLPEDFQLASQELEEKLARHPLTECSSLQEQCSGWVYSSPLRRFVHTVNNQHLIALGTHKKLMPTSMLKQEVAKRAERLAAEQGHPVGRKQLRDLKDKVRMEMLAKAPVVTSVTRAWIDTEQRIFVVEASGSVRAEKVVSVLRDSLESFAAVPLQAEQTPSSTMAQWLRTGSAPFGLSLDSDLELYEATAGTVRYVRHALGGDDIKKHLEEGKTVTRLGLTFEDRVSFVVTAKIGITRIAFLELLTEKEEAAAVAAGEVAGAEDGQGKSQELSEAEQFDADFLLMADELGQVVGALRQALGVKQAEVDAEAVEQLKAA